MKFVTLWLGTFHLDVTVNTRLSCKIMRRCESSESSEPSESSNARICCTSEAIVELCFFVSTIKTVLIVSTLVYMNIWHKVFHVFYWKIHVATKDVFMVANEKNGSPVHAKLSLFFRCVTVCDWSKRSDVMNVWSSSKHYFLRDASDTFAKGSILDVNSCFWRVHPKRLVRHCFHHAYYVLVGPLNQI